MTRRCAVCGGPVRRVRAEVEAHIVVEHYRCVARDGCRGGGHRVRDRTGDEIRTAGPVFATDGG